MMNKHLSNFISRTIATASLFAAIACSINVQAQTPQYQVTNGTSNNIFPLQSTTTNMCQWVLTPADFTTTVPTNTFITAIYIKGSGINTPTTTTYTNLLIKMGNTTISSFSSTAWLTGLSTVLSSASYVLSMPSSSTGWIVFPLQTPFLYTGSNFLVEISNTTYSGTGFNIAMDGSANRRIWGSVGSSAGAGYGSGLATIGVDVIPANCSGTPVAGTITTAAMNPIAPVAAGGAV